MIFFPNGCWWMVDLSNTEQYCSSTGTKNIYILGNMIFGMRDKEVNCLIFIISHSIMSFCFYGHNCIGNWVINETRSQITDVTNS